MTDTGAETIYCDGGVVGKNPSDYGGVFAWRVVRMPGASIVGEGRGIMVPFGDIDLLRAAQLVHDTLEGLFDVDVIVMQRQGDSMGSQVTNNQSELMAAVHALEHRPEDWDGRLLTDSSVTIRRMTGAVNLNPNQVPLWMIDRLVKVCRSRRQVTYDHVAGHPTKADLRLGHKKGEPVSHHQHWCDRTCVQLTEWYVMRIREVKGASSIGAQSAEDVVTRRRTVAEEAFDVYQRASLPDRDDPA